MATSNTAMPWYVNPTAGKILGYVYDNRASKERVPRTIWTSSDMYDYPIQETVYDQPEITVKKPYSDSKPIPIYEPPLKLDYDGTPLSDAEKFNLGALTAGAEDVSGAVTKGSAGMLASNYVPLGMRQEIGLPKSFDWLRNVDPSKPDWGLSQAAIYNPTSRGFFGDILASIGGSGPILPIAMMLAGVPPVYAGAISGATSAAAGGGNILKGALTGAATGAAASGLASLGDVAASGLSTATEAAIDAGALGGMSGATGIAGLLNDLSSATGIPRAVFENAARGAATSAIKGGDPLQGALAGAATAGVGGALTNVPGFSDLDPALQKALRAAATGATGAAVTGGDPFASALQGGAIGLVSEISKNPQKYAAATEDWTGSGLTAGTVGPGLAVGTVAPGLTAEPSAALSPTTSDILTRLEAQALDTQQMQQALADAGFTVPEQQGLLAGDYKQEGVGDTLARLAESALGAIVPSAQATGPDRLELSQELAAQPADYKTFFDVMTKEDPQSAYTQLSTEEKAAVDRAGQQFQTSPETRQADLLTAYRSGQLAPVETPTESWVDRGMLGAEPAPSMQDILSLFDQQEAQRQAQQQALEQTLAGYARPEDVQTGITSALGRQQADTAAAMAALEQATGQKITAGDAALTAQLAEQAAAQQQMETALRGELGGLGQTFDQRVSALMQQGRDYQTATNQALLELSSGQQALGTTLSQQEADRRAMEEALRGDLSGVQQQVAAGQQQTQAQFGDVNARITQLQQQGMSQADATSQALRELSSGQEQLTTQLAQATQQQQAMEAALRGELGGLGATFDQRVTDLMSQGRDYQAATNQALLELSKGQEQLGGALRGELTGLGESLEQRLASATAQQRASQQELESALRGELGGLGTTFDQRVSELMKQGQDYQAATNQALYELSTGQEELGGRVAGLGQTLEQQLAAAAKKQTAEQQALEAALRGEISGLGTTFDQRVSALMSQGRDYQTATNQALYELSTGQEELGGRITELGGTLEQQLAAAAAKQTADRQAMEAALRSELGGLGSTFDRRIAELLAQGESEQEAMRKALADVQSSQAAQQAATQQQISGVQAGLGQQIGGLGKTLSEALLGVSKQFGTTTQGLQQQVQQAQQQAGYGNLLGMLGLLGQQQQAPVVSQPVQVATIPRFYDITTGEYVSGFGTPYAKGGPVQELMDILKG